MTVDEKKLRELAEKATPGPWTTDAAPRLAGAVNAFIDGQRRQVALADGQAAMFDANRGLETHEVMAANADFIAAARTAVPELLDEVKRLRSQLVAMTGERNDERVISIGWENKVDDLEQQLAAMTEARDEACDLAESLRPDSLSASEWPHTTIIAELRKVGAS